MDEEAIRAGREKAILMHVEQTQIYALKHTVFFVGLTFAILALAVQHPASPLTHFIPVFADLAGWGLMLISGLKGLKYFFTVSLQYNDLVRIISKNIELQTEDLKEKITEETRARTKEQESNLKWQHNCFIYGLSFLMIAHGWGHLEYIKVSLYSKILHPVFSYFLTLM